MPNVFCNGVFDCSLHVGHVNLLLFARQIAEKGKLIVALDEDEKCMASKGLRRPIFNVHERAKSVLDLQLNMKPVVDDVEFFYTDTQLLNIIRRLKPDYIIKGGDWRDRHVVGSEYAKVLFYDRLGDYSTTEIIRRVVEKNTILK